jgi:hypothetical protein
MPRIFDLNAAITALTVVAIAQLLPLYLTPDQSNQSNRLPGMAIAGLTQSRSQAPLE